MASFSQAKRAKDKVRRDLMQWGPTVSVKFDDGKEEERPNVVGVGIGRKFKNDRETDELSIAVSVISKLEERKLREEEKIPRNIEGVPTDVDEVGVIQAPRPMRATGRRSSMRPAKGGVSIGHFNCNCAGTFGCLASKSGSRYILSNNHVMAETNKANYKDAILQPGPFDGGSSANKIARLEEFVPIDFSSKGRNKVDVAIAEPLNEDDVDSRILGIGPPSGTANAKLGTSVIKSGRTTGVTSGKIIRTDYTARVEYAGGRTAIFENQLVTESISEGGDSGSVVMIDEEKRRVCGLLFAGSERITVINEIENVTDVLNVRI